MSSGLPSNIPGPFSHLYCSGRRMWHRACNSRLQLRSGLWSSGGLPPVIRAVWAIAIVTYPRFRHASVDSHRRRVHRCQMAPDASAQGLEMQASAVRSRLRPPVPIPIALSVWPGRPAVRQTNKQTETHVSTHRRSFIETMHVPSVHPGGCLHVKRDSFFTAFAVVFWGVWNRRSCIVTRPSRQTMCAVPAPSLPPVLLWQA